MFWKSSISDKKIKKLNLKDYLLTDAVKKTDKFYFFYKIL